MRSIAILQVSDLDLYNSIEAADRRKIHADLAIPFQQVTDEEFTLLERAIQEARHSDGYILIENRASLLTCLMERGRKIQQAEEVLLRKTKLEMDRAAKRAEKQRALRKAQSLKRKAAQLDRLKQELAAQDKGGK